MLAAENWRGTTGPKARLLGTKLETFKIPFFLIGEEQEGKVPRARFLREPIPWVNQYVTFLLSQYRVRNEMPN